MALALTPLPANTIAAAAAALASSALAASAAILAIGRRRRVCRMLLLDQGGGMLAVAALMPPSRVVVAVFVLYGGRSVPKLSGRSSPRRPSPRLGPRFRPSAGEFLPLPLRLRSLVRKDVLTMIFAAFLVAVTMLLSVTSYDVGLPPQCEVGHPRHDGPVGGQTALVAVAHILHQLGQRPAVAAALPQTVGVRVQQKLQHLPIVLGALEADVVDGQISGPIPTPDRRGVRLEDRLDQRQGRRRLEAREVQGEVSPLHSVVVVAVAVPVLLPARDAEAAGIPVLVPPAVGGAPAADEPGGRLEGVRLQTEDGTLVVPRVDQFEESRRLAVHVDLPLVGAGGGGGGAGPGPGPGAPAASAAPLAGGLALGRGGGSSGGGVTPNLAAAAAARGGAVVVGAAAGVAMALVPHPWQILSTLIGMGWARTQTL
mmetsp:Transcript_9208/g.27722  ORF Transcript_9208/g.27722 Transcript_9208/m.27722 type:complete len:427 (+) Transcript_9208:1908-3188(+)